MAEEVPRRSWWRVARWGIRLLAVVLAGVVLWSVFGPDPSFPPLPRPNGHDDFVRAASLIEGELAGQARPREANRDDLKAFVGPNARALALLRAGLTKECAVPLAATLQGQIDASVNEVGPIRKLGRLVESEGWLALKDGRKADAVRSGLDLVRFGSESGRGGMMIQHQVGCALVRMGVILLGRVRDDLNADESRTLARALAAVDASREPARAVFARERRFARRRGPWYVRFHMALPRSPLEKLLRTSQDATEVSSLQNDAYLRLLIADLALHAYRLEHDGANPPSLAALVPRDLAAVPLDPFGGQPLRYLPGKADAMRLYSVGVDRADDGGTPVATRNPNGRGDLRLDPR